MDINKYKILNMKEHKTSMNITKINKYEKNWTAILCRSTKHMNITKCKKLNMTEHKTDIITTKNWIWQSIKQIWTSLNTRYWIWRNTKQAWTLTNTKSRIWRNTKQTWTLPKLTNTKKIEQQFYAGAQNTWTLLNTKN